MNHCYDYWSTTASNREQHAFDAGDKGVLDALDVVPRELTALPPGSLFLSFTFTLDTSYLSRDDRKTLSKKGQRVLIHDNPIKREWAFRVPIVSASTWKGNLRAAARILVKDPGNKAAWERRLGMLLGPDEGEAHKGRVIFFPSCFAGVERDLLNPRQRDTRTGTTPIKLEQVPAGQKARFAVLYAPFDLLWLGASDWTRERQLDLKLLGTALASMLTEFGFGAKKTLGLGKALPQLEDVIVQDHNGTRALGCKLVDDLPKLTRWAP